MNRLPQHQHDVGQRKKNKMKYDKYQAGLTALRNLITSNIKEFFLLAYNNSITGFCLVGIIFLMNYIRINYRHVLPKHQQDNDIALDAQWDPTAPIKVLFTSI